MENGKGSITFFKLWNEGKNQPEVVQGIEAVMERGVEEEVGKKPFESTPFHCIPTTSFSKTGVLMIIVAFGARKSFFL